jgi:hypothetical protein
MSATDALLWSFVALALTALLALAGSRWPVWAKALLVGGVTGLYFAADAALEGVWGRPARAVLPERFVLVSAVIEEPSKTGPGALYVWLRAIDKGAPAREPRAYRLPYEKDLHTMLDDGLRRMRDGTSQMGSAEPKSGPQGFSWLLPGHIEQVVKIRDLPIPQLPEK